MCTKITKQITDKKEVTGYKIVTYHNGKFYSPITGIEYIPGKDVKEVRNSNQADTRFISGNWLPPSMLFNPMNSRYQPSHHGFTGIFKYLKDAKSIHNSNSEIIVKMVLSKEIAESIYSNSVLTYSGKHIVSIKKLQS